MNRFTPARFGPDAGVQGAPQPLAFNGPNTMNLQPAVSDPGGGGIAEAMTGMGQAIAANRDKSAWQGALGKARPNPEAPVSTTQGPAPPLMPRRGFNPLQAQQIGGALGY